jgi:predicted transglutaminase-like cysteine proteinase
MKKNFSVSLVLGVAAMLLASGSSFASLKVEKMERRQLFMRLAEGHNVLSPLSHVRFCMMHPIECQRAADETREPVELNDFAMADLAEVNARVNRQIRPQAKNLNDFSSAQWALAPDAGDCNDFAVTKRQALINLGWPVSSVLLATVRTSWGEGHLVVVVRTTRGDMVLDNLQPNVTPLSSTRYTWLSIQSASDPRLWKAAIRRTV